MGARIKTSQIKAKSSTKAKPAASAQPATLPDFPFVGSGDARYFEFAELHVRFTRPPKPAEKAQIQARVPKPLTSPFDLNGSNLWVASEQGVGRLINAYYGKVPKAPAKLTTAGKFTLPVGNSNQRFNAEIVTWLLEAHAIVPILVAFRAHDLEAGGTSLDEWGRASLQQIPRVLQTLGGTLTERDRKLGYRIVWTAKRDKAAVDAKLAKLFGAE